MDQGFWVVIPVMRAPASPTIDRDNPFKSPPTEVTKTTPIPSTIAAKTTQSICVALVWALLTALVRNVVFIKPISLNH